MQDLLQFLAMLLWRLCEEESPDAHGRVLDVTGLQHAVEMLLDGLEVQSLGGFVRFVQHHEAEHIFFDAVPLGGIVGMGALEEGSHTLPLKPPSHPISPF